jgi:two-component system nitrate/nitrite response regulator NarL
VSPDPILREEKIRVLVADNSRIHTRLLADALRHDPLVEAIPFESEGAGLVAEAMARNIDVLVMGANFDDQSSKGFEILRELRKARQQIHGVLLLTSSKDELILKAFSAGARGLFSKNDPLELLSKCVREVHAGKVWANHDAISLAVDALASAPALRTSNPNGMQLLSKRELQVVRYLAEGLTNREIAERLKLSQHTIKNYLFRIFDKLGVSSRVELLFMAFSQADVPALALSEQLPENGGTRRFSETELNFIEKSAEAGIPAAQLALAQMRLFRRRDSNDLVEAYMWYLVATERALHARGMITKMLTPEQIEEAKHKASVRLSRVKRNSQSSSARPARRILSN